MSVKDIKEIQFTIGGKKLPLLKVDEIGDDWMKYTPIREPLIPCPHQIKGTIEKDGYLHKCPDGCDKC